MELRTWSRPKKKIQVSTGKSGYHIISLEDLPNVVSNRKPVATPTPPCWTLGKGPLLRWESKQQQLRHQPKVLAQDVRERRGCRLSAAARKAETTFRRGARGRREAPALPGHCVTHVEGLCRHVFSSDLRVALCQDFFFPRQVEKKRFNLSRTLNKPPCASTHCHAHQREVVLRERLEPGHYLMIPSTYQPGAEARFLIRVFSSSTSSVR